MEGTIGETRIFAGDFAPKNWMQCQGQTLTINMYQALYTVLGTTYGGDGIQNFKLPNLMGKSPAEQGGNGQYIMCVRGFYPTRD